LQNITQNDSRPHATRVAVSRSLRDFSAWWPHANAAGNAGSLVFQSAEVLDAWCDTIGKANQVEPLFVAVFGANAKPALLLAFGIEQRNGLRVLGFLDGEVSDYNAPVVFAEASTWDRATTAAAWQRVCDAVPPFDLAMLEKMPDTVGGLNNPLSALATGDHVEASHAVRLHGPWEEFSRGCLPNLPDSRRRRRKLEKLGDLRFEVAANDKRRAEFLEAMMRMKGQQFVETKGYDVLTEPGRREFYWEVTRRTGDTGVVHVSALLLNERILAAHWGLVADDRFYYLMPAHASGEWRAYSPGRLLTEWLLQWALENSLEYFDFTIGDEPYKFLYCDTHVPLRDAVLPMNAAGRRFAAMLRLKLNTKLLLRESRIAPALIAARNFYRRLRAPGS
jgi:CelD/BcsL family acetyltransferase involved in cellulose biosynthesis